jgi:3'-5' exonuclease
MIPGLPLHQVLFVDIETVSAQPDFDRLSPYEQGLWQEKARFWLRDYEGDDQGLARCYLDRAAILAEFGRVVCISVGILVPGSRPGEDRFRLKSFAGEDEAVLLRDFATMLDQHFPDPNRFYLCGHNLREFDVPYLCRRMIMLGIPLPNLLQISGRKPWEVKYLLDTLELWKFGDIKHFTSLKLLAHCLGIPSPKEDIDGSQVGRVFYGEGDLAAITRYCEGDVLTVAQVLRRFQGLPLLDREMVSFSSPEAGGGPLPSDD